jgi:hypothetical protein
VHDVFVPLGDQVLYDHGHALGVIAADDVCSVDVVRSTAGKNNRATGNCPVEGCLVRHCSHHKQAGHPQVPECLQNGLVHAPVGRRHSTEEHCVAGPFQDGPGSIGNIEGPRVVHVADQDADGSAVPGGQGPGCQVQLVTHLFHDLQHPLAAFIADAG